MIRRILFGLLAIIFAPRASFSLEIEEPYRSGRDLCPNFSQGELGKFLDVPVDYTKRESAKTQIYYWTYEEFDSRLATVVYFVGGPGGSNHGTDYLKTFLPNWNRVYFDQRGTSCSRPEDKSLLKDPYFFSSENTVLDAEEIRKHLNVSSWSVYGQSYGSVPATIYANKFPASTVAAVLSGVVFEGSDDLWIAPTRIQFLQSVFDSLPHNLRENILNWSSSSKYPDYWFSLFGLQRMRRSFAAEAIQKDLEKLQMLSEPERTNELGSYLDSPLEDIEYGFSAWAWLHLNCQELGMSSPRASLKAVFNNEKLEPLIDGLLPGECLKSSSSGKVFHASNFPISVPVTYILGENDGATPFELAIRHFEEVAIGKAQLLTAREGGHSILDSVVGSAVFGKILDEALHGVDISEKDIRRLNKESSLGWLHAKKVQLP